MAVNGGSDSERGYRGLRAISVKVSEWLDSGIFEYSQSYNVIGWHAIVCAIVYSISSVLSCGIVTVDPINTPLMPATLRPTAILIRFPKSSLYSFIYLLIAFIHWSH